MRGHVGAHEAPVRRAVDAYRAAGRGEVTTVSTPLSPEARAALEAEMAGSVFAAGGLDACVKRKLAECTDVLTFATPLCTLHYVSDDSVPIHVVRKVVRRAHCLLATLDARPRPVTIWWVPCDRLRAMPGAAEVVTPAHINGGYTYTSGPQGRTVFVVRREEFAKVVLHEVLHHLVDTAELWAASAARPHLDRLYAALRISQRGCPERCATRLNPNEAIVEAWAEVFHTAFVAADLGVPWRRVLDGEVAWALQQTRRVLEHQRTLPDGEWSETTAAYSYVVLRAALLWDLDRFLAVASVPQANGDGTIYRAPDVATFAGLFLDTLASPAFRAAVAASPAPRGHASLRMTLWGDL